MNKVFSALDREHLDTVWNIEQAAHSHPWKSSMIYELNGRGAMNFVLIVDGEVVGYYYAQHIVGEVSLLNIAVSPDRQGKGYGKELIHHFLSQCEQLNAESAWLEVRQSNQAAINLYLHEGFNEVDRRKDYYPCENGREDALLMSYFFLFQ
jgi:ribosomal-protein-alanine N-acetyltransferase